VRSQGKHRGVKLGVLKLWCCEVGSGSGVDGKGEAVVNMEDKLVSS